MVTSSVPTVTRNVPTISLVETFSFSKNMAMMEANMGVVEVKGAITLALVMFKPM